MPRVGHRAAVEVALHHADISEPVADDGETVVRVRKCKLNGFIRDKYRGDLLPLIHKLVADVDRVVAEAYLFANFHVLRLLEAGSALPAIDRNFYYRCLLAVSKTNARKGTLGPDLTDSARAFQELRPVADVVVDAREYNQVLADMSITMATMATNHLWMNLGRRLALYIGRLYPRLRRQRRRMVDAVLNPATALDKAFPAGSVNEDQARVVVVKLRTYLRLPDHRQYNTRAHLTLPLFHHILQGLSDDEARHPDRKGRSRLFTLLPLKAGFTAGYVPLSTMTLARLLKLAGLAKFTDDGRHEDKRALWQAYFNVQGLESRTQRFDNRLVTDGCGASVLVATTADIQCGLPSSADRGACMEVVRDRLHGRVVGVDPGVTDVVTVATVDGRVISYSSAQYYQKAGFNVSRRRTEKWNAQTKVLVEGIPSPRVPTLEEFEKHATACLAALPKLLKHRRDCGYRSMRFFRYCMKQAAVQELCDFVAPRDKAVVVAFGDWDSNSASTGCIRRKHSGPIVELRRQLARRPNVLFWNVDEIRTSQTCHC